jgi:hypothetical protein
LIESAVKKRSGELARHVLALSFAAKVKLLLAIPSHHCKAVKHAVVRVNHLVASQSYRINVISPAGGG